MIRMNRLLALIVLGAVLVLSACSGESATRDSTTPPDVTGEPSLTAATIASATSGVTRGTLRHDGLERTYRLFAPQNATTPMPLVVGLHGGLGSGEQFAANSHFETEAEREGFIAVFPDGVSRTWNGGNCCGQAASRDIDDVGFLAALIEHLANALPIDRARVFVAGHSNGGIMAFRFGCERPDLVKAVGSVAGSLEVSACNAATGTSLIAVHGDADQSHPLDGGQGPRSIAGIDFVSQERSLELWSVGMECEAEPEHSVAGAITTTTWANCRDGSRATLMVVAGADHPWPGGVGGRPEAQGRTSSAIDATTALWAFFESLD